jgi:HAD superfamily hydrolase (TIGR01490 family)
MALVFVDIDGTLIAGRSEVRFIRHLTVTGRLGPRALSSALLFTLTQARRYRRHVWKKNKAYLVGLSTAEIRDLARAFVRREIEPRLRRQLSRRIEEHRAAGDRVLLLSGTPDFIAAPLAELVGAEGCIASRCAERDGRFTADAPLEHPFAADKLRLAQEAARRFGCSLADCAAYGDSIHDRDLLQAVGRPVAVYPDRRLARWAAAHGGEILQGASGRRRWGRLAGARQSA